MSQCHGALQRNWEMQKVFGRLQRVTLVVVIGSLIACGGTAGSGNAAAANADPDAQLMSRGVDLMYKSSDPIGAEAVFREVLQRNPTHYGARYQLAVALDRGGKPVEARPVWDAVLKNAEAISDTTSARAARARLAGPDTASADAMMALGLDLMRRQNNPTGAAELFRKVLQRTPAHYGATYQLAMALDGSGQAAQARPLWQKVLGMATSYKDDATAQVARQHLAATH